MGAFGERLRKLRKQRGLSQNELSKHIGISKSSVNMYERGEREPSFETLEAIADYFNVDMDFLLGRSPIYRIQENLNLEKLSVSARQQLIEILEALVGDDEENLALSLEKMDQSTSLSESDMEQLSGFFNSLYIALIQESLNSSIDEEEKEQLRKLLEGKRRPESE
nr:helix-turn-helix transcriptional regulator [uncultured Oscillibacter sp.]